MNEQRDIMQSQLNTKYQETPLKVAGVSHVERMKKLESDIHSDGSNRWHTYAKRIEFPSTVCIFPFPILFLLVPRLY